MASVLIQNGYQPAHYGRRCNGTILPKGDRCGFFWTYRECDDCGHKNDITARLCAGCKKELVDPNEKLREDFLKRKKDPTVMSTDIVKSWQVKKSISKAGNEMLVATFFTDYNTVTAFFPLEGKYTAPADKFLYITKDLTFMPETITYYKSDKYWTIVDYGRKPDEIS